MTDITANGEIKSLGQVAFEAYCAAVGGKTFDGKPIPGWNELHGDRLKVQGGWEAAAQAVRQHMLMIQALDVTPDDYRGRQGSRWVPVTVGYPALDEPEPEFSAPIGRGEAPTGEPVDVEAGPDEG